MIPVADILGGNRTKKRALFIEAQSLVFLSPILFDNLLTFANSFWHTKHIGIVTKHTAGSEASAIVNDTDYANIRPPPIACADTHPLGKRARERTNSAAEQDFCGPKIGLCR